MIGGLLPAPGPVPRRPSRLGFLFATAVCPVLLLVLTLWANSQFREDEAMRMLVRTSAERRIATANLLLRLTQAESAQRGYVITDDPAFLTAYRNALGQASVGLSRLEVKDATRLDEARDVARLRDVVEARSREMAIIVNIRQHQGFTAAFQRMITGRGVALMNRVRALIADLSHSQQQELGVWQHFLVDSSAKLEGVLRGLMLLVALLLLAGSAVSWRVRMRRYRSEQDAHEVATLLREVFSGNADATLLLDPSGIIQAANGAAVRLFGYNYDELVGRDMLALFKIADEGDFETRIGRVGRQLTRPYWLDKEMRHRDGHGVFVDIALGSMDLRNVVYVIATIRDIGERKTVERIKDEFLANVSHELRTPLTSVIGALGLLRNCPPETRPATEQRLIEIAENNSRRLIRLINDLLDIDRIASGRMRFERAPFDLVGTARAAIDGARGIASARAVRIELTVGPRPHVVHGDHHRLLQVLANLLDNAIRASPADGLVSVAIAQSAERVVVTVDDEGAGVAPDLAPRIFERFAQASDAMPGGSGLGLAISREIVVAHEGRIWFGEAPGGGARFAFSLPTAGDQQPLRGTRRCILVGTADSAVAQRLGVMLEAEDCGVEYVETDREALEAARSGRYDILILDSALPDDGGAETARVLRRRLDTRKLPVIIVGGDALAITGDAGATALDPALLLAAVRRAMERSAAIRPTLLHIDGDPDMLEVAAAVLAEHGRIVHATSIVSARAVLATRSVDIVILDPSLPDGSGSALLPDLIQPDGSVIPTIIYSAIEAPPELEEQADVVLIKSRRSLGSLARAIQRILATADTDTDAS
jgi:PAS domain S-box-containing protein